jgi:hypothetical protein
VATGPGVRTTARHLLEELGTGGTRVTLAVEQAGPVGVVMGRFFRPEVLGSVMIHHGPDRWAQVIYFTSEAEAREGERKAAPPEVQAVIEQLMALTPEPLDFIDLRQPLLYSPPAGAGLPGPREAAEAAEEVQRST